MFAANGHKIIPMSDRLIAPVVTPKTAEVTQAEAAAMLRAAFNLFERWQLSDGESRALLGDPSSSTFYRWKRGDIGSIPRDTIWRLGDLMGIHKALRYMFTDPKRGYAWIRADNVAFGGKSALARMLAGAPSDISAVRAYLDAERAAW
jgi:Ni/Co efflux regulator RcnB